MNPSPVLCIDPDCAECVADRAVAARRPVRRLEALPLSDPLPAAARCVNPVCDQRRRGTGRRCNACRVYHARHGSERPEYLARGLVFRCQAAGCPAPRLRHGWCNRHYLRVYRAARRAERSA